MSTLVADRALAPSSRRTVVEQITNDAHRRRAQIGRCARSDGLEKQVFDEVGRPALPPPIRVAVNTDAHRTTLTSCGSPV
ncbi:hypothetical protein ABZ608_35890 [Streptomyces sp. NPDC013172]|uniref:hypothetical protein n=1 Tax=Streptomyces sp. NPDC013172 TaxID=3155009 RepID=UPI0033F99714